MNHYIFLTVKEISSGRVGLVVDVDESTDSVLVEFSSNRKWLKEYEIIVFD